MRAKNHKKSCFLPKKIHGVTLECASTIRLAPNVYVIHFTRKLRRPAVTDQKLLPLYLGD